MLFSEYLPIYNKEYIKEAAGVAEEEPQPAPAPRTTKSGYGAAPVYKGVSTVPAPAALAPGYSAPAPQTQNTVPWSEGMNPELSVAGEEAQVRQVDAERPIAYGGRVPALKGTYSEPRAKLMQSYMNAGLSEDEANYLANYAGRNKDVRAYLSSQGKPTTPQDLLAYYKSETTLPIGRQNDAQNYRYMADKGIPYTEGMTGNREQDLAAIQQRAVGKAQQKWQADGKSIKRWGDTADEMMQRLYPDGVPQVSQEGMIGDRLHKAYVQRTAANDIRKAVGKTIMPTGSNSQQAQQPVIGVPDLNSLRKDNAAAAQAQAGRELQQFSSHAPRSARQAQAWLRSGRITQGQYNQYMSLPAQQASATALQPNAADTAPAQQPQAQPAQPAAPSVSYAAPVNVGSFNWTGTQDNTVAAGQPAQAPGIDWSKVNNGTSGIQGYNDWLNS